MLEAQDFLRRITRDELRVIMLKDVAGFNRASNLVLDDLTAVFLTENPDWQFRREFEQLAVLGLLRKEEHDSRLYELLGQMGISRENFLEEVLKTYANQNGYVIVDSRSC
jgi:hypothetical protein